MQDYKRTRQTQQAITRTLQNELEEAFYPEMSPVRRFLKSIFTDVPTTGETQSWVSCANAKIHLQYDQNQNVMRAYINAHNINDTLKAASAALATGSRFNIALMELGVKPTETGRWGRPLNEAEGYIDAVAVYETLANNFLPVAKGNFKVDAIGKDALYDVSKQARNQATAHVKAR
jgi:hypothetical protein